jgi:hypothetical protein
MQKNSDLAQKISELNWAKVKAVGVDFFGVFHRWGWRVAGSSHAESGSGSSSCQPNGHFSNRHLVGPTHFFYWLLSLEYSLSPSILISYYFLHFVSS